MGSAWHCAEPSLLSFISSGHAWRTGCWRGRLAEPLLASHLWPFLSCFIGSCHVLQPRGLLLEEPYTNTGHCPPSLSRRWPRMRRFPRSRNPKQMVKTKYSDTGTCPHRPPCVQLRGAFARAALSGARGFPQKSLYH